MSVLLRSLVCTAKRIDKRAQLAGIIIGLRRLSLGLTPPDRRKPALRRSPAARRLERFDRQSSPVNLPISGKFPIGPPRSYFLDSRAATSWTQDKWSIRRWLTAATFAERMSFRPGPLSPPQGFRSGRDSWPRPYSSAGDSNIRIQIDFCFRRCDAFDRIATVRFRMPGAIRFKCKFANVSRVHLNATVRTTGFDEQFPSEN